MESDLPFEVVEEEHLSVANRAYIFGKLFCEVENSKGAIRRQPIKLGTEAKVNGSLEGSKTS